MDFRIERCKFMHCVPFVIPADKEGVEIKMGVHILYWCARRGDGRIVGVAQAWRSGKTHPCDTPKPGGAWRLSGLFVDPSYRGKGVGFALQKARVEWLRDVQKADSIDSFAFKPAPLLALGFSPVREFKMGTTRVLWERPKAGEAIVEVKGKAQQKPAAKAKSKRAEPKTGSGSGWIDAGDGWIGSGLGVHALTWAEPKGKDEDRGIGWLEDGRLVLADEADAADVPVERETATAQKKPEPKRVVQLGLRF